MQLANASIERARPARPGRAYLTCYEEWQISSTELSIEIRNKALVFQPPILRVMFSFIMVLMGALAFNSSI